MCSVNRCSLSLHVISHSSFIMLYILKQHIRTIISQNHLPRVSIVHQQSYNHCPLISTNIQSPWSLVHSTNNVSTLILYVVTGKVYNKLILMQFVPIFMHFIYIAFLQFFHRQLKLPLLGFYHTILTFHSLRVPSIYTTSL